MTPDYKQIPAILVLGSRHVFERRAPAYLEGRTEIMARTGTRIVWRGECGVLNDRGHIEAERSIGGDLRSPFADDERDVETAWALRPRTNQSRVTGPALMRRPEG